MSNYSIGLQRAKGGYKVVLFSTDNGKLVLAGEVIKNNADALAIANALRDSYNNKRDVMMVLPMEVFPASKKWPKNAGPAKKKAVKKAPSLRFRVDNSIGYSRVEIVRRAAKKTTKKK